FVVLSVQCSSCLIIATSYDCFVFILYFFFFFFFFQAEDGIRDSSVTGVQTCALPIYLPEPVLLGVAPFGDIYLARGIPGNVRSRVLEAAKARYLAHPQVAAVFTPAELRRLPLPSGPADEWSLADRFRASFDPERTGDLVVAPQPHITSSIAEDTYLAPHDSPGN